MQRVFKVPFLPLPLGIAAIILPWIWFLAFPARLTFVIGEPIDIEATLQRVGITSLEHPDRTALRRAAELVRAEMQHALDGHVAEYGNRPYDVRSLLPALWKARHDFVEVLPLGWPAAFLRHERNRARPPARNAVHAFVRDLDLAGFYLPFGWPLLSIARALRRPPCGHRGVRKDDLLREEGAYLWQLAKEPLPARSVIGGRWLATGSHQPSVTSP